MFVIWPLKKYAWLICIKIMSLLLRKTFFLAQVFKLKGKQSTSLLSLRENCNFNKKNVVNS
jgi:hypothetical protein